MSGAAAPARTTIVIATRNRHEVLLDNLARHGEGDERPPVILVDNGSSDGTPAAVRAAFPDVRVIELGENRGAAARNVGTRAARTPYVAFCDDDSWFAPGALARAERLMDEHPRLAVLNAHVLVGPEQRVDDIAEEMAKSPLPRAADQPGHPLLSFVACAVVVRRDALLAVGGFSERLGVGGEEEIVSWDLVGAGWLLSYVPEVVAHHCPPKSSGARPMRREIGTRNTLWTTWLRRPLRPAARRTLRDLRRFPLDRVTVRGIARAVAGLPWVLRERRVSPPHVERMRELVEDQQLNSRSRRYV